MDGRSCKCFTTAKIWVPLSLFQLAGTDISSFEDSAIYYYLFGNQTDRYILVQDKNKKASSNANVYIPILHDQKIIVELDSMVAFPGLGNYDMEETIGPIDINSKNFSNKSKTQRTAYQQYITSDTLQISENLIGYLNAIFSYKVSRKFIDIGTINPLWFILKVWLFLLIMLKHVFAYKKD